MNLRADVFPHLAHRRRKSTGTAIGHRAEQTLVAGLKQNVQHHFFGDGVADLHRPAGQRFGFGRQLGAAERGPVDAVATGSAAHRDDVIARTGGFFFHAHRDHAGVATIHQRVAQISIVEHDCAVDRRDAHAIAIVADAGNDALHDAAGVQHARWQVGGRRIGRGETKHVGITNRPRAHTRAHRIADYAADAGRRAAVRFECRGMVVRFDFETGVKFFIKLDDAGVVLEHADTPIVVAQIFADRLSRRKNGFLEHVVEPPVVAAGGSVGRRTAIVDTAGQRFVAAMFRPSLCDRFQFDVGRIAADRFKVIANGPHFDEGQIQLALA